MTGFEQAVAYLPERMQPPLRQLPLSLQEDIHEIRLREQAPVTLSTSHGDMLVTWEGQATAIPVPHLMRCTHAQIEGCFLQLCDYSVHSHQQEILQGFVSTRQGVRVGIAGSAVMERGEMVSMRRITSLCIRVSRPHDGCADALLRAISERGRPCSTLICGEPSSGKSSLLRDAVRQLSGGYKDRRFRVSVVDERGELSAGSTLHDCDVLLHFPKAEGIRQAIRCLAPDVVAFDELGSLEETQAVTDSLHAGVTVLSTAHGATIEDVLRRPQVFYALQNGGFEKIVFLAGRESPGEILSTREVEDVLSESHRIAAGGADRDGHRLVPVAKAAPSGGCIAVV